MGLMKITCKVLDQQAGQKFASQTGKTSGTLENQKKKKKKKLTPAVQASSIIVKSCLIIAGLA